MDSTTTQEERRHFVLPSIATMTQGMGVESSSSLRQANVETRDSGNWSMQSPSKHSSTISSNTGLHLQTILNSDDSPNRFSGPTSPVSVRYPSTQGSLLPSLNQPYEGSQRGSVDASNVSFLDSRRSSIDSRVGVNLGHLAINTPASPYESNNASQVSLSSSLQQQRGVNTPLQPKVNGTPLSPFGRRPQTSGGHPPVRQAPQITANPRANGMPNPLASTPTKGFAWAFPDQPDRDDLETSLSPASSRQGSFAPSMNSSMHTTDTAFTHHHSMQHKSITNLQPDSSLSAGNYSRTPELRVSHKLAERKRRSEMKDLFDNLNETLPTASSNKSSKWEILSKAIEYIRDLQKSHSSTRAENDRLKIEVESAARARQEYYHARTEISVMLQQLRRLDPNGNHLYGEITTQMQGGPKDQPGSSHSHSHPRLAPMQSPAPTSAPTSQPQGPQGTQAGTQQWNGASAQQATNSQMQGVEYNQSPSFDRR